MIHNGSKREKRRRLAAGLQVDSQVRVLAKDDESDDSEFRGTFQSAPRRSCASST